MNYLTVAVAGFLASFLYKLHTKGYRIIASMLAAGILSLIYSEKRKFRDVPEWLLLLLLFASFVYFFMMVYAGLKDQTVRFEWQRHTPHNPWFFRMFFTLPATSLLLIGILGKEALLGYDNTFLKAIAFFVSLVVTFLLVYLVFYTLSRFLIGYCRIVYLTKKDSKIERGVYDENFPWASGFLEFYGAFFLIRSLSFLPVDKMLPDQLLNMIYEMMPYDQGQFIYLTYFSSFFYVYFAYLILSLDKRVFDLILIAFPFLVLISLIELYTSSYLQLSIGWTLGRFIPFLPFFFSKNFQTNLRGKLGFEGFFPFSNEYDSTGNLLRRKNFAEAYRCFFKENYGLVTKPERSIESATVNPDSSSKMDQDIVVSSRKNNSIELQKFFESLLHYLENLIQSVWVLMKANNKKLIIIAGVGVISFFIFLTFPFLQNLYYKDLLKSDDPEKREKAIAFFSIASSNDTLLNNLNDPNDGLAWESFKLLRMQNQRIENDETYIIRFLKSDKEEIVAEVIPTIENLSGSKIHLEIEKLATTRSGSVGDESWRWLNRNKNNLSLANADKVRSELMKCAKNTTKNSSEDCLDLLNFSFSGEDISSLNYEILGDTRSSMNLKSLEYWNSNFPEVNSFSKWVKTNKKNLLAEKIKATLGNSNPKLDRELVRFFELNPILQKHKLYDIESLWLRVKSESLQSETPDNELSKSKSEKVVPATFDLSELDMFNQRIQMKVIKNSKIRLGPGVNYPFATLTLKVDEELKDLAYLPESRIFIVKGKTRFKESINGSEDYWYYGSVILNNEESVSNSEGFVFGGLLSK